MELLNSSAAASQLFWVAVFFIMQYLLLAKIIAPKLKQIFENRDNTVKREIQIAEELTSKAQKLKEEFELKVENAQKESAERMSQNILKLKLQAEQQLAKLDEILAKDNLKHEIKLQNFCASIEEELENISLSTASMLINKITNSKLEEKKLAKYLEKVE